MSGELVVLAVFLAWWAGAATGAVIVHAYYERDRQPKSPLDPERTTPWINWERSPCWRFIIGLNYGFWVTFPHWPGRALSVSWRPPWAWQPISIRSTGGPAWWGSGAIRTLAKPCAVCRRAPRLCNCGDAS